MTDTIDTAWSPQQEIALADFSSWYESQVWAHRDENQIFRLFGFAGTGKTTLAKHLASDIEDVVFCSFTGTERGTQQELNRCESMLGLYLRPARRDAVAVFR